MRVGIRRSGGIQGWSRVSALCGRPSALQAPARDGAAPARGSPDVLLASVMLEDQGPVPRRRRIRADAPIESEGTVQGDEEAAVPALVLPLVVGTIGGPARMGSTGLLRLLKKRRVRLGRKGRAALAGRHHAGVPTRVGIGANAPVPRKGAGRGHQKAAARAGSPGLGIRPGFPRAPAPGAGGAMPLGRRQAAQLPWHVARFNCRGAAG